MRFFWNKSIFFFENSANLFTVMIDTRSTSFYGIVEIVVKLFQKALYLALQFGQKLKTPLKLSLTQFRTICLEAVQLFNDRPLSQLSEHRDNLTHVFPNKLVFWKLSSSSIEHVWQRDS